MTGAKQEPLPIDDALDDIVEKLRASRRIVIHAEPGAGKTTRVPPAILDAGLASAQIIILQPRRVAARSAAFRVADERGREIGQEIGYQVRHEGRHSSQTRILFCTEGVFLRRLQDDPLLEGVSVVVFDEFHERNIDSDLALAMVRQVQTEVRPELCIVVMSATLDAEPISAYLGHCPIVRCSGRTFPIEIEYLKFAPSAALPQVTADGVRQMFPQTNGHVLVFLPGVGEIRRTQDLLIASKPFSGENVQIMPLYGDMALADQQRVLHPTAKERKIILATNVAETSLTIQGVTAVVDSGMARVNRFNAQLGLNRLELERISRASAQQRAGRAGRTEAGQCLRLWTERDQQVLRDFDEPEIARVELSQSLLHLIAWGEPDVTAFPWFESPPPHAVERALQLLGLLGAVDGTTLTELGKRMAHIPLQPRLARLLIEGSRRGVARRAALCAALLSERDPFIRDKLAVRSSNPMESAPAYRTDSDLLDRVSAIEEWESSGTRQFSIGTLSNDAAKYLLRTAHDLLKVVSVSEGKNVNGDSTGEEREASQRRQPTGEEAELRAVLAAFPDRVCRRRSSGDKRAVMVGGRGVRLSDESGVTDAELFIAVELIDLGQSETLVRQASAIEKAWLPSSHIATTIDAGYDIEKQKITAVKRTRYVDLVLDEKPEKVSAEIDAGAALAKAISEHMDASTLLDDGAKNYIARVQCLREWMPELELPDIGETPWHSLLSEWCTGCTRVDELTGDSFIGIIKTKMTRAQLLAIDENAPERILVPSGHQHKLLYERGKPPVLAVRIQELFGMTDTPRIAGNRVQVLLHLLAPNYRVQQITPDLANFWKNTYPQVRKDLKARYPKHPWPDNPLIPVPRKR